MLYHGVVSVMMLKPPLTMTFFFFALEALLVRFVVRVASLLQACGRSVLALTVDLSSVALALYPVWIKLLTCKPMLSLP